MLKMQEHYTVESSAANSSAAHSELLTKMARTPTTAGSANTAAEMYKQYARDTAAGGRAMAPSAPPEYTRYHLHKPVSL